MAAGLSRAAPRPALMPLVSGVIGVGVALTAVASVSLLIGHPQEHWRPLLAFLLISSGWRLQCSVRVGGDRVVFFWGDAALVLSVGLVTPAWLIVVTAPAVGLALGLLPGRQPPLKAAYNSATAVIASAAAVGALTLFGATPLHLDSTRDVIGLGLAAVIYVLISDLTTSAVIALHSGRPFWEVQGEGRLIQLVSLVGNLGGAAAIWTTVALDPRLAVVAALAVLGTQQGYLGLRRVQHERRRRHELALAVSRLTGADGTGRDDISRAAGDAGAEEVRCDETVVLSRAADLALELFRADAVEIEVASPSRTARGSTVATFDRWSEKRLAPAMPSGRDSKRMPWRRSDPARTASANSDSRSPARSDRRDSTTGSKATSPPLPQLSQPPFRWRTGTPRRSACVPAPSTRRATTPSPAWRIGGDYSTRQLVGSRRVGTGVRLTMLEVTGLRELARTVGHAAVDRLIVQVAQRLTAGAQEGSSSRGWTPAASHCWAAPTPALPLSASGRHSQIRWCSPPAQSP